MASDWDGPGCLRGAIGDGRTAFHNVGTERESYTFLTHYTLL